MPRSAEDMIALATPIVDTEKLYSDLYMQARGLEGTAFVIEGRLRRDGAPQGAQREVIEFRALALRGAARMLLAQSQAIRNGLVAVLDGPSDNPLPPSDSHTAGPWRLGATGESVVSDSPTAPMSESAFAHYGGHMVAESVFRTPDRHLIAAAPELLAAAEGALAYIDAGPDDVPCTALRAAIRKARGESNG